MIKNIIPLFVLIISVQLVTAQGPNPLVFPFDKKYGQVEVGGPYVGVEFHHSRPLPSRISFYYPVANSIDVSTDYWKRDESRPMALGVKIGNNTKKWIGRDGWRYDLSPHMVTFYDNDGTLSYQVKYEFCQNEPAMSVTFIIKNETSIPQHVTVYSHLLLALRTCQTYARKDSAEISYNNDHQIVSAQFSNSDTKNASVFVVNAGDSASKIWNDANLLSASDDGKSYWLDSSFSKGVIVPQNFRRTRGIAAYEYGRELQPGGSMTIIQIIGSAGKGDGEKKAIELSKDWKNDVGLYNDLVKSKSSDTYFRTNDTTVDRSIQWAKAILTANAHYLDGRVVPMPCPAEYNFFFTHDLLMTNLGAVNYDLERVRNNLLYVASLAKDSIIPHAYYWKDDGFKTELCTPSNWNHLWFVEVSASYLRHSLDTVTIRKLYPFITKSVKEIMTQLGDDHLMHAYRPDWWDLGWKEGSRTYITALSIRVLEDYLYIASYVDRENKSLRGLEDNAIAMRSSLVSKLWNDSLNYLINYNGSEIDRHKYMGSLIAPSFHLLDGRKTHSMLEAVKNGLLAPSIGIRAVSPADFHKDSVIKYFKIAGNEAGDEYTYINGGVWPHNNAWYALALNSIGESNEALAFVKQTMTVDGAANSPNGIPAMYEYRYSNEASPRYGEIDKPSFLWAGGFYLYTMYTLEGMNDNVWNLSISENHVNTESAVRCSYTFENNKEVTVKGNGKRLQSSTADDKDIPSLVLPLENSSQHNFTYTFGKFTTPFLSSVNAIVHSVQYHDAKKNIECKVSSFHGHKTTLVVTGGKKPARVMLNGKPMKGFVTIQNTDSTMNISLSYSAGRTTDTILIQW